MTTFRCALSQKIDKIEYIDGAFKEVGEDNIELEIETSRSMNTEGMPEGWTSQIAPNGRVFYINHNHKEQNTTWVDPRSDRLSPLSVQTFEPAVRQAYQQYEGPLPKNWEKRVHSNGQFVFIDHSNRTTQWQDPRGHDIKTSDSDIISKNSSVQFKNQTIEPAV